MRQPRVLVATLPERGHYHPLLGPAAELARRGCAVAWTCAFDLAGELAAAGATRVLIPPDAPPPPASTRGEALARVLREPAQLAAWIRALLIESPRRGIEPLRAVIRELRPDVIALDTMAYDAAIAAELEGVPWVGWATSLNPVLPERIDSELLRTLRALDGERHALFAAHGLTARFRCSDVLSPRGTAVFATEALVGDGREATLVGPSLGGRRGGAVVDPEFAQGRPIVYVSFGSQAWHQPQRFERLLAAAQALDLALVAATGELTFTAPRVRCVPFAAQLAVLGYARALVTHGGANSVMEACAAGVPMLVAPICNDQPHNRWFVERAGCGIGLDLEACGQAELVDALRRLVGDGRERARSTALRASYAARDGAVGAAELCLGALR